jgi:predicted nucleic acid-binding Zn ribbon protein
MPTYLYECVDSLDGTIELNVPIEQRDHQDCPVCKKPLSRKFVFTGLTWAPTAGGMR